ncbi:MAG: NYN domain-containing protein [Vicinamibacteria bacterium]|nr:NYN domain-containing protein [Vicinamibacteria bacterium]
MARVRVYVDGFNLYYRALRRTPYRWLDIGAMCRALLPGDDIEGIRYFTATVAGRRDDPGKPQRQQIFFRALRTIPGLTIHLGQFRTRSNQLPLTGVTPVQFVWVDRTEEKGSDVNLAAYLLADAFRDRYDVGVVVSNDSDLLTAVRLVREETGKAVGVLNPSEKDGHALQKHATFCKSIRQKHLVAAQFPATLTDGKGTFHKPAGW